MNIVRVVFNKNLLFAALFLVSTVGAVRYALSPRQFRVICDQRLALEVQTAIKKMIAQAPLSKLTAKNLCAELQNAYPAVQAVSLAYKSSLHALVKIQSYKPYIKIVSPSLENKEYVLCKDASDSIVTEKKLFNEHVVHSMPTVIIEGKDFEDTRMQPEFLGCIKELKQELFDEYKVTWHSKSEIILQSHDLPMSIIADASTVHDKERMQAVRRIFETDSERYAQGIRADIRLQDSVICSALQGKNS